VKQEVKTGIFTHYYILLKKNYLLLVSTPVKTCGFFKREILF